jgi:hypothetical protein
MGLGHAGHKFKPGGVQFYSRQVMGLGHAGHKFFQCRHRYKPGRGQVYSKQGMGLSHAEPSPGLFQAGHGFRQCGA